MTKHTVEGPVSSLGLSLKPSWLHEPSCILTTPSYDFEASTHLGAAYRHSRGLILESLRPAQLGHWRPVDPVSISHDDYPSTLPVIDEAIYGGHFFSLWGHFLFESLTTAAVAPHLPNWPVIFSPFAPGDDFEKYHATWNKYKPLLSAAGWGSRELILQSSAMRINQLIVPERLSVFGTSIGRCGIASAAGDVFRTLRRNFTCVERNRVPMVARRPSWAVRLHPAEEQVYELLAERGFRIVNGVAMSPQEQVETFANASALVGFAGSNLHNSLLCPEAIPVLEIGDERSFHNGPNATQVSISSLLGQRLQFLPSFSDINGTPTPLSADEITFQVLAKLG